MFVIPTLLIVYDIVDCKQTEYVGQTSSFTVWYFTADNDNRPISFCVKPHCCFIEYGAPLCQPLEFEYAIWHSDWWSAASKLYVTDFNSNRLKYPDY